jgi:hypothetical protein
MIVRQYVALAGASATSKALQPLRHTITLPDLVHAELAASGRREHRFVAAGQVLDGEFGAA